MEGKLHYTPPSEIQATEQERHHRFNIEIDGYFVGQAEVRYFSAPLPHYRLESMSVDDDYQHQGAATKMLNTIEKWIDEKQKPCILVDSIQESSPASGMYARRGWKAVPEMEKWYVYNWPEKIPLSILKGYNVR